MDASPYVPDDADLGTLRDAVQGCRGCPLFEPATQAVFGEGDAGARLRPVAGGDRRGRAARARSR